MMHQSRILLMISRFSIQLRHYIYALTAIIYINARQQDTQYPNMETAGILRARERHER